MAVVTGSVRRRDEQRDFVRLRQYQAPAPSSGHPSKLLPGPTVLLLLCMKKSFSYTELLPPIVGRIALPLGKRGVERYKSELGPSCSLRSISGIEAISEEPRR